MAGQWTVHSGAEDFGPWSASRIRDELRAGRIDAFDMVSLAGSSVKRPLFEVDEIFETVGVQAAAIVSDIAEEARSDNTIKEALSTTTIEGSTGIAVDDRPRAFEALAAPQRIQPPAGRHHVRKAAQGSPQYRPELGQAGRKSYLILIPGAGPRGPFTSKDILILWYAKQLVVGTFIQRIGDSKRIEISRFASFYERAAPSGMAFIGHASLAHSAKDRSLIWLIAAIFVAAGILVGAVYWRARRLPVAVIAPQSVTLPFSRPKDEGISGSVVMQSGESSAAEKITPMRGKSTITRFPKVVAKTAVVKKPAAAKRPKQVRVRPAYKPQVMVSRAAPPAASPKAAIQQAPQVMSQPNRVSSTKASVMTSAQKPTMVWTDGAMVTLTGYSFNVESLNACEAKCKIPMRGPKGDITAVFFKEAIGPGLGGKASNVAITGTVRKDSATDGISIFVRTFR